MQARVVIRAIDPPADPASARSASRREGRHQPPSRIQVLLVEDDRRLAHSLRRGLEEVGFGATAAHDGPAGLELGLSGAYDVVVLDVELPGADGYQVCSVLRERRVETAVLMLSARDTGQDRLAGVKAGADAYMTKPFALHELVARVRSLARRSRGLAGDLLTAGPLRLETDLRRVSVAGAEVRLTGKEFDILEHFLLHPGRVFNQRQILENVWSYDFDGGRNLVEVYMGRLRRKLGGAGLAGAFVTVRGSGYRFEPAAAGLWGAAPPSV